MSMLNLLVLETFNLVMVCKNLSLYIDIEVIVDMYKMIKVSSAKV